MNRKDKTDYIIQSVTKAFDVLELFHDDIKDLSPAEVSSRLKMTKNVTVRFLGNLEERGYLELDRMTERYRLGLKTLELSQAYLRQGGLLQRSKIALEEISRMIGETTYLAILEKKNIVYVTSVESSQSVRVCSCLGQKIPAYCTASGKIHLAFLTDLNLDELYPEEEFASFTPSTHRNKESLRKELLEIKTSGYAVDNEEFDREVRCVAVPVFDYSQTVIAALSLSAPSFRLTPQQIEEDVAPYLMEKASELSRKLGYTS